MNDTQEKNKYVNLRFRETDYWRLRRLFGGQGVTITDACKKAAFYLADRLESGACELNQGGVFDRPTPRGEAE